MHFLWRIFGKSNVSINFKFTSLWLAIMPDTLVTRAQPYLFAPLYHVPPVSEFLLLPSQGTRYQHFGMGNLLHYWYLVNNTYIVGHLYGGPRGIPHRIRLGSLLVCVIWVNTIVCMILIDIFLLLVKPSQLWQKISVITLSNPEGPP